MKNKIKTTKGKKVLSVLLALVMVLSVASPAFSQMLGITAKAAESKFEVELGFNNLFLFEKWANNSLSSTVLADGVPKTDKDNDGLELDIVNGSFTLTKDVTACNELYTAFSMNETDATVNEDYYMIDVEPNTTYTFSYNVTGNIWVFTPYVFFYDDSGLWIKDGMVAYATPGYENNSFEFTTPSNAESVQIRWTIGDNSSNRTDGKTSVSATVKDIAIYKSELLEAHNLFDIEDWAKNEKSSVPQDPSTGTIVPDVANGAIKFTTVAGVGNSLFGGFGTSTDASNDAYHTTTVQPDTDYTLTYSIGDHNLPGPVHCQAYVVEMDSDGKMVNLLHNQTAQYTNNQFQFTTKSTTVRIQVVFCVLHDTYLGPFHCTVSDIGVYKTEILKNPSFSTVTGHEHRKYYPVNSTVYGKEGTTDTDYTLPTPSYVPEGMVFAGWYTGENGAGKYIGANTEIHYESLTVYPKFEPAIDKLEIVTGATKTNYTLGEKFNPTGLVLKATIGEDTNGDGELDSIDNTFNITSGYRWEPEYLTSTGTPEITVSYGGKTVKFKVNVSAGVEKSVIINGISETVTVANNKYTLDYSTTPFSRYEMTYYSDCYVKGVITMDADTEEFFLEPSDNGSFASYIDGYIRGVSHYSVISIEFTCLNKDYGNFELKSLTTINAQAPSETLQFYNNDEYKVGVDLAFGGVISYIENKLDTGNGKVTAATYTDANGKPYTKVDYADLLPAGSTSSTDSVNLINTKDKGRYLQQSYYGTDQPPFVKGDYNGLPWNYNPVQGGNLKSTITGNGGQSSKVIDYRITDTQIYVKTRPLDWGKNSVDYPDSFNTPSYMETWYSFEDGLIKADCRMVDFSGYPSNYTTQEMPALYTIEPLNHFVYNNVTKAEAFGDTTKWVNTEEPDFWGVLPSYNEYNPTEKAVDVDVDCYENWAAFTASENTDSFGIGVYSAGITDFHYGCFPAIYEENQYKAAGEQDATVDGGYVAALKAGTQDSYTHVMNDRHAVTLDPATEMPTSYIAPIGEMTYESYKPITYSFYVTTGTAEEIRNDFDRASSKDAAAELAKAKIAVPETVYMTPADGASQIGQLYVNNKFDSENYNNVVTVPEAGTSMYLGLQAADATSFSVKVTNVLGTGGDVYLAKSDGTQVATPHEISRQENKTFTYTEIDPVTGKEKESTVNAGIAISEGEYGLRFSGAGLQPGEKTTVRWDITVTKDGGSTETHTAYTVMYAPQRTVGAVAESRQTNDANNEISTWITGANGVNHSAGAPLGSLKGDVKSAGTFKNDPLVHTNPPEGIGSSQTANDYINVMLTESDTYPDIYATEYKPYVLQTAPSTDDHTRSASYLGLLTVDESRYTNTNQIPNLKIGYDVLRFGTDYETTVLGMSYQYHTLQGYTAYYTLGTDVAFTPASDVYDVAPEGWETYDMQVTSSSEQPVRKSFAPSYDVSEIDGKYIHALNQVSCDQVFVLNSFPEKKYATAGTSVLCSVTNKSGLREAVLNGYAQTTTTPELEEALQKAGTVLGDPSATQDEINEAKKELNNALENIVETFYALKYDNLFSAYEFSQYTGSMKTNDDSGVYRGTVSYDAGTITVESDIASQEVYSAYGTGSDYYLITVEPNKEYVFEYDVLESSDGSQAFLFFYGDDGVLYQPTNKIKEFTSSANGTTTTTELEDGNYMSDYGSGTGHMVFRFKTNAKATKMTVRFGNKAAEIGSFSTFSNIRLIDAAHYYEDVEYPDTEHVYKEYASYGTLPTLSRTGYTFKGWSDAGNTGITGATIATEHRTIYSKWDEHMYTITYDKNGGDMGDGTREDIPYSTVVPLSDGTGFTKDGFVISGWSTDPNATSAEYQLNQKVSGLTAENGKTVTLYAVWADANVKVLFDNLFDFSEFTIGTGSLTIDERTETGFTVTSTGNDANTGFNGLIDVVPGKTYILTAETTFVPVAENNTFDIYINTLNENKENDTSTTVYDNSNGAGKDDLQFVNLTGQKKDVTNPYIKFTAGDTTKYIRIRFDANSVGNKLTVNNIRFYEEGTVADGVSYEKSITVGYGKEYGESLPTPTRTGYDFAGWYTEPNGKGNKVEASSTMNSLTTLNLYSYWTEIVYTVNYSNNGASDVNASTNNIDAIGYTESFELPTLTCDYAEFVGWSFTQFADPYGSDFKAAGSTVKVSEVPETAIDASGDTPVITLHAVWRLNDSVVVDDTVIADFGKPIKISPYQMSDAGIFLYHADPMFSTYNVVFSNGEKEYSGSYGTFKVNNDGYTITYTPTSVMQGIDTATIKATLKYKTSDHEQDFTSTITVAPASNVLYEEDDFITYGDGKTYKAWINEGSSSYTEKLYDKNTGIYNDQNLIDKTPQEVHGYNSNYGGNYGFSDGSYSKVTVSANDSSTTLKENMSDVATFTFKGTGFDLISACGTNTGIQLVKVKDASTDTLIKSYIVDTYLGDDDYLTSDNLLHQVPILAYRTTTYDTYTVEVTAAYLSFAQALTGTAAVSYASAPVVAGNGVEISATTSTASSELLNELEKIGVDMGDNVELVWMDDNSVLNGGTGATDVATAVPKNGVLSGYAQQYFSSSVTSLDNYIDGFRVYNTLNGGDPIYDSETEQNNTYYNIVEEIGKTNSSTFKIIKSGDVNFTFDEAFSYDSFRTNGGAKGEIYLEPNQAIAFTFTASTDGTPSKVMLGMRAVNGSAEVKVCTTNNISSPQPVLINSATEMYYDVSEAGTVNNGTVTMAIQNTSDKTIAVNNLKLVDGKLNSTGNGETPAGSNDIVGGSSSVPEVVLPITPVTPDSEQNEAGNIGNAPETDVEDNTEEDADNSVTAMFPGMPVSIASFLDLLFAFLGQLVGSLGF